MAQKSNVTMRRITTPYMAALCTVLARLIDVHVHNMRCKLHSLIDNI